MNKVDDLDNLVLMVSAATGLMCGMHNEDGDLPYVGLDFLKQRWIVADCSRL
jgi:hypothetical protein